MTPDGGPPPVLWSRKRAIGALRERLDRLSDGQHSTCQVAAELGIFCRGFRQWDDHEFHSRWKTVLGQSTHLSRPQMERLADLWQLLEQIARGVRVTCDAQSVAPGACRGWQEFSNEALARFCGELLGKEIVVSSLD